MADEVGLVVVGRVVKPHGIRGEVSVVALSDVPGRFAVGVEVEVAGRALTIAGSRPHQGRVLLRFDGIADRTAAEELRGHDVRTAPVDLSAHDAWYVHELVGLTVLDDHGVAVGTVAALVELPEAAGYDLLEILRPDGSPWLLPAAEDLVEVVEDDAGQRSLQLIDPPEGLVPDGGGGR